MYLSALNIPKSPWYLNLSNAELNKSVVKVDNIAQKNICQESFMFQNEETSSIENRSPPTGAPNAEATPAAAPALIKLRLQKPAFYIYWSEDFFCFVTKNRLQIMCL